MNTSNNITITNDTQGCVNIIHTRDYSIIVYDIDSNGTVYTNRPAYQTHTIINGASLAHTTQAFSTVQPTIISTTTPVGIVIEYHVILIVGPVAAVTVTCLLLMLSAFCLVKKHRSNIHQFDEDFFIANIKSESHHADPKINIINDVPVTDNSCYESVTKKDRLQCTVTVPNPCYEVVSTEQHKTTDEHKRTTNTNYMNSSF